MPVVPAPVHGGPLSHPLLSIVEGPLQIRQSMIIKQRELVIGGGGRGEERRLLGEGRGGGGGLEEGRRGHGMGEKEAAGS